MVAVPMSISRSEETVIAPPNSLVTAQFQRPQHFITGSLIERTLMEHPISEPSTPHQSNTGKIVDVEPAEPFLMSPHEAKQVEEKQVYSDFQSDALKPSVSMKTLNSVNLDEEMANHSWDANEDEDLVDSIPLADITLMQENEPAVQETAQEISLPQDIHLPLVLEKEETIETERRPSFSKSSLRDFEPLIPIDWLNSPRSRGATTADSQVQGTPSINKKNPLISLTPQQHASARKHNKAHLLIETLNEVSSPSSTVKYSQRDVDELKKTMSLEFEKEFELAQLELAELESKRADLLEENKRMQETLVQWENSMTNMIQERHKEVEEFKKQVEFLKVNIEQAGAEKERVEKEHESAIRKYKQIRIDYEDLKEVSLVSLLSLETDSGRNIRKW